MKRENTKRRTLRRIAAFAALIIILSALLPVTNVFADYTIDDSSFEDIAKSSEQRTVYTWHRGKPPITLDGTPYPTIMYWNNGNQYLDLGTGNLGGTIRHKNIAEQTLAGNIKRTQEEYQRAQRHGDGEEHQEAGWTCIWTQTYRDYGYKNASSLPLNLPALHQYGVALSFTLPDVPYFIAATGEKMSAQESSYAIEIEHGENGTNSGFMTSMLSCYNWVNEDLIGRDRFNERSFDWLLDVFYADRKNFVQNKKITRKYYYSDGNGTYESNLKDRVWVVRTEKNGRYTFRQDGVTLDRKESEESESFWLYTSWGLLPDALKSWKCHMELFNTASRGFGSHGWTEKGTGDADWSVDRAYINANDGGYENENWAFDLAYCTPMPMSFVKGNYTVQNGQTVNLDGPIAIDKNVTITVNDGGVLAISGWVVNNGTIKVKKGGTLLMANSETLGSGTLATFNSTKDEHAGMIDWYNPNPWARSKSTNPKDEDAGTIACDGTIIVMQGCKLHAGGKTGLLLGSSAQVVNYGAIIAANIVVNNSYTIENRGDQSALLLGYDITDGGYTLTAAPIEVKNGMAYYPGVGIIQDTMACRLAADAVYGKGAGRVYFYSDISKSAYNSAFGVTPAAYKSATVDVGVPPETNKYYCN